MIVEQLQSLATPIEELKPLPGNPRKGDVDAVAKSYEKFGQRKPIVANRDGTVIAGNHQLLAAKKLGWSEIAVVFVDDDDLTAKAFALADNRTADMGTYDDSLLAELLADVSTDLELLMASGYTEQDLDDLIASIEPENIPIAEPDAIPDKAPAKTVRGDVWLLGPHRVMCGDSTIPTDVDRLMNGSKADICFTSPPYALGKSIQLSGNKSMSEKGNAYGEHDDSTNQWSDLMQGWFNQSQSSVEGCWIINVQPLAGNKRDLIRFMFENVDQLSDIVTWDKGHAAPAMAQGVMSSRFEWLLIFAKNKNASRSIPMSSWRGTIQNVYLGSPQRNNEFSKVHAATMPIHLPIWVMEILCNDSKSVYDPFCGTGTTIIASHQLNRKSFGMEIDPHYCDIICARFQKATGIKPIAEFTGQEHDFLVES